MPILSILIPTLTERQQQYETLLTKLLPQCYDASGNQLAYIIPYRDNRQYTTGYKRNKLVAACDTPYCAFFDDDDMPSDDYISSILTALEQQPDVVTFKGKMFWDSSQIDFEFRIGHPYDHKPVKVNGQATYRRMPNHLCPMLTEIHRKFPFPDIVRAEDFDQCHRMADAKIFQSEVHINKYLYYYFYTRKQGDYANRP